MDNLVSIGTNEPSFYYPPVPPEIAADPDQVLVAYRRSLGRERMYQVGGAVWAVLALWYYVRAQTPATRSRRSRSSSRRSRSR
jgi:hypothetical protein